MNEILKRDQNDVTVLGAVTDDINQFIRMLRVDPATGRLLVSAVIPGTTDGQIKIDMADTDYGYIADKLVAGSGITFTINNPGGDETMTISATGQQAYDTFENSGTPLTQRSIADFDAFFILTDDSLNSSTDITLDTAEIANDSTFYTALANNNSFATLLATNDTFISTLANNSDFIDYLVGNAYFTTTLANDSNFINTLSNNSTFLTNLATNNIFTSSLDLSTIGGLLNLTTQVSGVLPLANGGTGSALTDPGYNAIMGWDDTDNSVGFWHIGANLSYDHATHTLSATGGGGTIDVYENGVSVVSSASILDFTGANVSDLGGGHALIQILGGAGGGNLIKAQNGGGNITIPGGTLGTNNAIRFEIDLNKPGGGTSVSDTITLSYGGVTFATLNNVGGAGGTTFQEISHLVGYLYATGATNSQNAAAVVEFRDASGGISVTHIEKGGNTTAVDSTVDQTFSISISHAQAGQLVVSSMYVEKMTLPTAGNGSGNQIYATAGNDFTGGTLPVPVSMGDGNTYGFFGQYSGSPTFNRNLKGGTAISKVTLPITVKDGNFIQLDSVAFYNNAPGSPTDHLIVSVQEANGSGEPTGVVLASGTTGGNVGGGFSTVGLNARIELEAPSGGGDVNFAIVIETSGTTDTWGIGCENFGGTNTAPFAYNFGTSVWDQSDLQPKLGLFNTYNQDWVYTSSPTTRRAYSYIISSSSGLHSIVDVPPSILNTCEGWVTSTVSGGSTNIPVMISGSVPGFSGLTPISKYICDRSDGHITSGSSGTIVGRSLRTDTMLIIPA